MLRPCCLLFFVVIVIEGRAQQQFIKGFIKDSLTHFPIRNASITNENSRTKTQTDPNGFFYLYASHGDLLQIRAVTYHTDTVRYSHFFTDTLLIFLSPKGEMLEAVKVTSYYTKYQLDSIERKTNFDEMRGTTLTTVSRPSSGFGLSINLDRIFKRKFRSKKKEERLFNKTEEIAYVQYRFSADFVAKLTGLKGDALRNFIFRYTPSYQWLRQHPTNDELIYYVSDKLKAYKNEIQTGSN